MPDYRPELETLLIQNACQRLDHIGGGIYKWYSGKTGIVFNVEPYYPSLVAANEVLKRAGIAPIIKPGRDQR
jgi:hypothetical protein